MNEDEQRELERLDAIAIELGIGEMTDEQFGRWLDLVMQQREDANGKEATA